jgi:hypothetical protein
MNTATTAPTLLPFDVVVRRGRRTLIPWRRFATDFATAAAMAERAAREEGLALVSVRAVAS